MLTSYLCKETQVDAYHRKGVGSCLLERQVGLEGLALNPRCWAKRAASLRFCRFSLARILLT
jgi:hypothetical protein